MRLRGFIQSVARIWNALVEPVPSVQDAEQRRSSRLLAGLMLSSSFIIAAIFVPQYLLDSTAILAARRLAGALLGLVVTLTCYGMSRRGNYLLASKLAVTAATGLLFLQSVTVEPEIGVTILYYLVVLTLFSGLFLPLRFTALLGVAHVVGMVLIPIFVPAFSYRPILEGPATFSILLTLISLVFTDYRSRMETARRTDLAESENRYRMISEVTSDYAFSYRVEEDGEVYREWVTDAYFHVTGYRNDEVPLKGPTLVFHPDDASRAKADIQATIHGATTSGEYRIITKSGQTRWLMIYRYPVWDERHNRVIRYFGAAQDITERKDTEAARLKMALQQERLNLFGSFMEAVSHDFRTSLATIETSRYLIEKTLEQSHRDKYMKRLDNIQQAVHHVTEQLENLDTLSSLLAPNMKAHDLNPMLESLIRDARQAGTEKDIQIVFTADNRLPLVMIDENEFQRAIKHLLNNAVNFTPKGGTVMVRSILNDDQAEIEIQDTGVGIATNDLPQIFNYFYRADRARPTQIGGIGLGLSIVKMIVEAHNGTIQVESVPEQGSTFKVSLPVVIAASRAS